MNWNKLDWDSLDEDSFEELCGDTIRAMLSRFSRGCYVKASLSKKADMRVDGRIDTGGLQYLGLKSPVFVSCKTAGVHGTRSPSQAIEQDFLKKDRKGRDGISILAEQKPASVILLSNHDLDPTAKDRIRKKVGPRFRICFQGPQELQHHFLTWPYLAWKYFPTSWHVRSCPSSDAGALRKTLLANQLVEKVPIDKLLHPAVDRSLELQMPSFLRITGKPGAGKSVALWQILTKLPECSVVFPQQLDHLRTGAHLNDLLLQPEPALAIVIDDLYKKLAIHGGLGWLPDIVALARNHQPRVPILIAYRSTEAWAVEKAITPAQWRDWDFAHLSVDDPPESYIASLVTLACDSLDITPTPGIAEGFVKGVREWENTPACVVSSLLPYCGTKLTDGFFPVALGDRTTTWGEVFREMVTAGGRQAEIDLLQSVSLLTCCRVDGPSRKQIYDVFTSVIGHPPADFDYALEQLQDECWLSVDDDVISGHDIQLMPEVVGLLRGGQPSSRVNHFRDLLLAGEVQSLDEERSTALLHLSRLYWDAGRVEAAANINEGVLTIDPHNTRALCNRAVCRLRLGQDSDALADFADACRIEPENIGAFEMHFNALARLGQNQDAVRLLDRRLASDPDDLRLLRHATRTYVSINDSKRALIYAKQLWVCDRGPDSAAALAEAMAIGGRRKRAMALLRGAIKHWPDSGQLHAIAADKYRTAGQFSNAEEHARQAVALSPNQPEAHVIFAWLLFQLERLDECKEVVSSISKLIPRHPALLAIRGLLALRLEEDPEKSIRLLSEALVEPECLVTEMLSNVYLTLGDAHIHADRVSEARKAYDLAISTGVDKPYCALRRASAFQDAGKLEEARRLLGRWTRDEDIGLDCIRRLADIHNTRGNSRRAAVLLRRAHKTHPEHPGVLNDLISTLFRLGHFRQALPVAQTFLDLNPDDPDRRRTFGLALRYLGRHEEAVAEFDEALRKDACDHASLFNKAESLEALGRLGDAACIYRRAHELDPAWFGSGDVGWLSLARCLKQHGHPEEALAVLTDAVAERPASAILHVGLAQCASELGQHETALDSYDSALKIDETLPSAWLGKAATLKELGRFDDAARVLIEKFVPLPPSELMHAGTTQGRGDYFAVLNETARLAKSLVEQAPDSRSALLLVARTNYSEGWLFITMGVCQRVLELDPQDVDALILLSRSALRFAVLVNTAHMREDARTRALDATDRLLARHTESNTAILLRTAALANAGKKDEALALFARRSGTSDTTPDDWAICGRALGGEGAYREALDAFDNALELDPLNIDALAHKAVTLQTLDMLPEARSTADRLVATSPKDARFLNIRARIVATMGDFSGAARDFAQILRTNKRDAEAHEGVARTSSDTSTSAKHYRLALEIDPDRVFSLRELGILELKRENVEHAEKLLSRAVELAPDDDLALSTLGLVYTGSRQWEKARTVLEASLRIKDDCLTRHLYAEVLAKLGDSAGARAESERAVTSLGDDKERHERMLDLCLAQGLVEGQGAHLSVLLKIDPENASHHAAYASCCAAMDASAEADEHFRRAIELAPSSATISYGYAGFLLGCGNLQAASEEALRAIRLDMVSDDEPNLPLRTAILNLGFQLRDTGLILQSLCAALPVAREKDAAMYENLLTASADVHAFLEGCVAGDGDAHADVSSYLSADAGLYLAEGNTKLARQRLREAFVAGAQPEFQSLVNWATLFLEARTEDGDTVSEEEVSQLEDALVAYTSHADAEFGPKLKALLEALRA